MRSARNLLLVLLSLALLGSDTAFTRGYVYSHIGSGFTWSNGAQSWSGSTQAVSCNDWVAYIANDGTACTTGSLIGLTWANAHATNAFPHSPILADNTFTGGNFASWSSSNTGGCSGFTFTGQNTPDEDGDAGVAYATSSTCYSTPAVVTLVQTVSISGTPTSQSYSFWYYAKQSSYGDPTNCTQGFGGASLSLKINSTTISVPALTLDGAWHHVSGTTTALSNGSNTITLSATLTSASGQISHWNAKIQDFICSATGSVSQPINVDNFSLTATY